MVLGALVLCQILAGRSWRNLPVVALVACLGLGCALSHAGAAGLTTGEFGRRLGFGAVFLLIGLIGGRVVPSFTRNWLSRRSGERLPAPTGWLDHAAMAALVAGILGWMSAPAFWLSGILLLAAGIGLLARLARWRVVATASEPLVLILHLGYGWLGAGLAVLGLVSCGPGRSARLRPCMRSRQALSGP
jgi:uncharacterized protein involved in response to NO